MTRSTFIAAATAFLAIAALSIGPAGAVPHRKPGVTVPSASATVPLPRPRPAGLAPR